VIQGAGLTTTTVTAADLASMPRVSVEVDDHGTHAKFEGVALSTLLTRAGAPLGEGLRGDKLALALVVKAADGYRAVFALAELDPAFMDKTVLLADRRDGAPLNAHEGPYRIIAVGDKRPARWVRQVLSLTLKPVD
jgi:hypothetical protein